MSRKKTRRPTKADTPPKSSVGSSRDAGRGTASSASDRSAADSSASPVGPSRQVQTWLSIWVTFHLIAILISFTSVVEPSGIHNRLASLIHPYLRPVHFSADDRRVYLAHGDPSEQPHRLQITTAAADDVGSLRDDQWQTFLPHGGAASGLYPGLAPSDRNARWLASAAMLADNEQPSLVAELLLPIAKANPELTAIRIVRLPTDLSDVNAEQESPYVARVVRSVDRISLVQLQPVRLSSQAIGREDGSAVQRSQQ